ncbi:MAG TPA: CopD family protein [Acetobacteraceae bacterium]|nr:CopD family protein [Acetobacteraceae bacterium]
MGNLLYVLHLLGAVLWVGGMAFALLCLRPAAHEALEGPQRLALMQGVFRRFFLIVWHAMPIVLVSGWVLLFGWYGGFRGAGWHVHLMHLTGILMGAVYLSIALGPWKQMRAAMAAGDRAGAAAAMEKIRMLVLGNLVLGLLTVAVAAWGRFGG